MRLRDLREAGSTGRVLRRCAGRLSAAAGRPVRTGAAGPARCRYRMCMHMSAEQAKALLGCRPGATAREVRAAYRHTVRSGRPDTGGEDGAWLTRVQAARDVLLAGAAPDRRRRDRVRSAGPGAYLPLRRATWTVEEPAGPRVDVRL